MFVLCLLVRRDAMVNVDHTVLRQHVHLLFILRFVAFDEFSDLRRIPVVILTTSQAEQDILKSYNLHANCYITKPVDLERFITVVKSIETFWLSVVKLPQS